MNKEQVIGIVRHVFTAAGTIAVYKGWVDDSTVILVTGAIVAAVSGIWSTLDKTQASIITKGDEMRKTIEKTL